MEKKKYSKRIINNVMLKLRYMVLQRRSKTKKGNKQKAKKTKKGKINKTHPVRVYHRLREPNFLVVRVRWWCWPEMSPYLPLCIRFLHSMPNGRKKNGRTHLFFERGQRKTADNLAREKQQQLVVGNRFTCSGAG